MATDYHRSGNARAEEFPLPNTPGPTRVLLKDLETPPALVEAIQAACKHFKFGSSRDQLYVEEELKLQFYYGGRDVACIQTDHGRAVLKAGTPYIDDWPQVLDGLDPDDRHKVMILTPEPWDDR